MSLTPSSTKGGTNFRLPFKLERPSQHPLWIASVDNAAFTLARKSNLRTLKLEDTINIEYFATKHSKQKAAFTLLNFTATTAGVAAVVWTPPTGPVPAGKPAIFSMVQPRAPGSRAGAATRATYVTAEATYQAALATHTTDLEAWFMLHPSWRPAATTPALAAVPGVKDLSSVVQDQSYQDWNKANVEESLSTGEGFMEWVYTLWSAITTGISDEISRETGGVALGDIVGKLRQIQIAVNQVESVDPTDLFLNFSALKMAHCGNKYGTYDGTFKELLNRLNAAGHVCTDEMIKKIYLKGLHPKIFAVIVADTKGNKSLTFKEVRERCLAYAVSDAAREELQALLPAQGPPEFAHSNIVGGSSITKK